MVLLVAAASQSTVWGADEDKVRKVLRDYTAAKGDREKQSAAVGAAEELGAAACQRVQLLIGKELFRQMNRYGAAYRQTAFKAAANRLSKSSPAEITTLRQRFREIRKSQNFSKSLIQSQGDPIIERLESILVMDREAILAANSNLKQQRDKLQELGMLWERCAIVAFDAFAESVQDPEVKATLVKPSFESFLTGEEEIEARMAIPMPPRDRAVLAANARIASRLDRAEGRAILATNLLRIMVGQSACAIDPRLCGAARDHSNDMKTLNFFSHTSKVPGKQSFTQRAKNFNTSSSAENIAINGSGGAKVVRAWYLSPGHHKNVFGSHKRIGVGKSGRYWTQMFGR